MKSSEIYRRAARSIERSDAFSPGRPFTWRSACEAISDVCKGGQFIVCLDKFNAMFCPDSVNGRLAYYFGVGTYENQGARILALCFMAAISESEGD
jgi:hypothetical protein